MASEHVLEVSDETFEAEILNSSIPAVVDFWAEWCGPCRAIAPLLDTLAVKYQGKVKVAKLNVDDSPESATAYKVMAIPTILAFKDGELVGQVRGGQKARIEELFSELVDE